MNMPEPRALLEVRKRLAASRQPHADCHVPSVWIEPDFGKPVTAVPVNPRDFFLEAIDKILARPAEVPVTTKGQGGDWSAKAVIYNLFVRLGTAFDHNQNGEIDVPMNAEGFRETGTFLKSIALLPYIKALGADTIHLLPISAAGQDGKKGDLGSPYAIRNPYRLDENLSEPFLGLGVEKEFKAFVEAAHHLGMAVVLEFVFRTAAKDGDWVKIHPDWFYWIKEDIPDRPAGSLDEKLYGAPIFPKETLEDIKERVAAGNMGETIPPSDIHRSMFMQAPKPSAVRKEGGRWTGTLPDGTRVRIPGAFADWPPDDPQPPWGDVTYLKLYDHPHFNYIAYNTVRRYDSALMQRRQIKREVWEEIANIIPHYLSHFEIDGVMIDMGHALPRDLFAEIVERARKLNPNFAFWEESFAPTQESRKNGYNLAVGYLWGDIHNPHKVRDFIKRCSSEGLPLPFFGAPETHDTPRTAAKEDAQASKFYGSLISLLPVAPYIHGGFELRETEPVNTGLGFTPEEIRRYPPEKLALFSSTALHWIGPQPILGHIQKVSWFRRENEGVLSDGDPKSFKVIPHGNKLEMIRGTGQRKIRAILEPETKQLTLES